MKTANFPLLKVRNFRLLQALRGIVRATVLETAPGGHIRKGGYFTLQNNRRVGTVKSGHGLNQCSGLWMVRVRQDLSGISRFYDLSQIHHIETIRYGSDQR